ncbi:Nuclear actin-protein involved in chromatin remodeling [Coemansia spiralis]|uniref:Nuclear actin-protein involved in chromatin remodeling n=2 Tax=Coemansia TaxID=4863 RepID=A0A9W8G3W4_9FUNG|nr:Nuclear actin-protein involved in chromatin remodeling [Coemansia sp. RSA 1358]KAJ2671613.1 Nuclear actin-protein involved in chromatin remodeling [Coemansia spiralis]
MVVAEQKNVYDIPDGSPEPSLVTPSFDYAAIGQGGTPLIIDNGSGKCRAGWATESDPRLEFDSIVAKYRNRKVGSDLLLLVGTDVHSDPMAKSSIRSGFDNGVVTNFDVMENILDYVFTMLGCEEDSVNQPIVMTETVCNPYTSRKHMSELLFECYNAPSVAYGIDSVWSYYKNIGTFSTDGLVFGSGNVNSHVIPIYDSRAHTEYCKRLNIGALSMEEYLLKLLQLKYPNFPMKITEWQSEQLISNFAYIAEDFDKELGCYLTTADSLADKDIVVQFPFPMPSLDERTEEEIQKATERRREQAKKMQEMAAKKRQEKLETRAKELEELLELRSSKAVVDADNFAARLDDLGFADEQELDEAISNAQNIINRAQNKELGLEPEEKEDPVFPLVNMPDEELTDEQRQEKRKQVFLKASHDARERTKVEKEKERVRLEELAKQDEEQRLNHFDEWLANLQAQRNGVISRMEDRRLRRKELNDRRSHASQMRMRNIADLAANETATPSSKRRRRGDQDDDFGAEDDDWNIYRDISKEEEAEEDEEDEAELDKYNKQLEKYAPDYLESLDREARAKIENTTMYRFTEGCQPAILEKPAAPQKLDNTTIVARAAREYQLHLNVERIRVPEIVFRPSLIGIDQAGLVETIDGIVKQTKRLSLVNNIFVTGGGFSQVSGILKRLEKDVLSIAPVSTPITIRRAADPLRDAWRGAAQWSIKEPEAFKSGSISRQDYLEYGGEYLREHGASNKHYSIPSTKSSPGTA